MVNCKKCGNEFEPKKGLINFCSIECRNSRIWSDDDKTKKSNSAKKSNKVKEAAKNRAPILVETWAKIKVKREEERKQKILTSDYISLSFESLRDRIKYEQNECCNNCKNSEWLGVRIPLELEHKDGNHFNNERENLEMLCPNCHALTSTWRGRNKTKINNGKISDEKLLEQLLINNWNMRQSLIFFNLAANGGNYKRCHKLKREYNKLNKGLFA